MREIVLSRHSKQGGAFRMAALRHHQDIGRLLFHFGWKRDGRIDLRHGFKLSLAALLLRHLRGGIA